MTKIIELPLRDRSTLREHLREQITTVLVERGRLDNIARETIDARIDAAMDFVELCSTQPLPRDAPPINIALPEAQAQLLEQALGVQCRAIVGQVLVHFLATLPAIVAGKSR
ncbi:MAG: hypothetical protein WDZ66_03990 [Steroidobacteraceae bacterium]